MTDSFRPSLALVSIQLKKLSMYLYNPNKQDENSTFDYGSRLNRFVFPKDLK